MSISNDAGHFFQTTASLSEIARKNAKKSNIHGRPLKLSSKLLAITPDLNNASCVFVAEAAGTVKHVNIESNKVLATLRPNTSNPAPLTCLAATTTHLYAGSWDKSIYAWPLGSKSANTTSTQTFTAHTDFVKALLCIQIGSTSLLISCSADATIIVWNTTTAAKLHTLKGHSRGVQTLALASLTPTHATIFSGDSNREIRLWSISLLSSFEISTSSPDQDHALPSGTLIPPLLAHETSVYALTLASDGDLWTASADFTAKCLSSEHGWAVDTTLTHPDYVRDIQLAEDHGFVVTACRDENVRVWDRSSGKLVHVYAGHYEEVTGLCVLAEGGKVVSVSIDGTVRTWGLGVKDIAKSVEDAEMELRGEVEEVKPEKKSVLTEEEERELAELMGSDDED